MLRAINECCDLPEVVALLVVTLRDEMDEIAMGAPVTAVPPAKAWTGAR
jgi:hypothetical protein